MRDMDERSVVASIQAMGKSIVEHLRKIDDTLGDVRELLAYLASQGQDSWKDVPDDELPIADDGACPNCGSVKVSIPDEEGRERVRVCRVCSFPWSVFLAEDEKGEGA